MRHLLLAAVLLLGPMAGCNGPEDTGLILEAANPMPTGLVLTYELDQGDGPQTQSLFVQRTQAGYDLHPWNTTREDLQSPFLHLNKALSPRGPEWAGLVKFPLQGGTTYEATAGEAPVEVTVTELASANPPFDDVKGFELVARDEDGDQLAALEVLPEPTLFSRIQVKTPDGTEETWVLQEARELRDWNALPRLQIGQWWSYDALTQVGDDTLQASNLTLVYNANETGPGGNPLYVLNAQELEHRLTALPFHRLRQGDLSSQSGILNNLLAVQWAWPLREGKTWTGSSLVDGQDTGYRATVSFTPGMPLPDGSWTTGFTVQARTVEGGLPLANWTFAPRIGLFTSFHVQQPGQATPALDWDLVDWGSGFHGTLEIPHRELVYSSNLTSGPTSLNETFQVGDQPERLQVRSTVVRREGASPNNTLALLNPNGTVVLERTPEDFAASQAVQFTEEVPSMPGAWKLNGTLVEGTSMVFQVHGVWATEEQVDYR